MSFTPSSKILDRYADVLVNYALNSGEGVREKEVVFIMVPECAKPILEPLRNTVLRVGAYPIIEYLPDGISRSFYENASNDQLDFFPDKYLKGRIDQADHSIAIIAESDKHELEGVDPKKIMKKSMAMKPYKDWKFEKEGRGEYTWTLALFGTDAMASEAKLSLKEYWNQIIKACYLDDDNPVRRWKKISSEIADFREKLTALKIEKLRIKAENTDLEIKIGADRKWLSGMGRNIPSFEIFVSPDWRGTNGHIQFTEPLYVYGNLIEEVYLEFKDGLVTKATAKKGEKILKEMIATKDANKVGEFSLTDSRHSRIVKFMAETLFDENVGGKYGNTHLALGSAYKDSYKGDQSKVSANEWNQMGYNDSIVHTDIVATSNREVVASLADGNEIVIYKDGKFTI